MADTPTSPGFAERAQEPYASIPTDPDAFLLWASAQPRERGRFELSQAGTIDMQAGTTRYHNLICMNVVSELRRLLDLSVFTVAHADFAVKSGRSVRYPDVVVDKPGLIDNGLVATYPVVIAEVLSPSTTGTDFIAKVQEYAAISSLKSYFICSQDDARVWVWTRKRDKSWPQRPSETAGRERTIKLGLPKLELALAAVYCDVPEFGGKG